MKVVNRSKLFIKKNASTILTIASAVGAITTTVLAVKATPKAMELLQEAEKEKGEKLDKLEVVTVAGPSYIPTFVVGVSTLTCLFGANYLSMKKQASLMSAYALLGSSFKEYKTKVNEVLGDDANQQIKDEIAKDKYEENDISVSDGNQLFYDEFSQRYFESTIYKVQQAEYYINRDLSMRDYATLNEFYEYLGIPHIEGGDDVGWSTGMNFDYYWQVWIDFNHHKTTMEDGTECTVITMFSEPDVAWEDYW